MIILDLIDLAEGDRLLGREVAFPTISQSNEMVSDEAAMKKGADTLCGWGSFDRARLSLGNRGHGSSHERSFLTGYRGNRGEVQRGLRVLALNGTKGESQR